MPASTLLASHSPVESPTPSGGSTGAGCMPVEISLSWVRETPAALATAVLEKPGASPATGQAEALCSELARGHATAQCPPQLRRGCQEIRRRQGVSGPRPSPRARGGGERKRGRMEGRGKSEWGWQGFILGGGTCSLRGLCSPICPPFWE